MINNLSIDFLIKKIKSSPGEIVLLGAGTLGKLTQYALAKRGLMARCFCDNEVAKQGKEYCGLDTISSAELIELGCETHVFMCNNYFDSIALLEKLGFKNIHNCMEIIENTDFSKVTFDIPLIKIQREIALHRSSCIKPQNMTANVLNLKYLDVVITERCSLKCKDCSNLMQYYVKPQNSDLDLLYKSLDRIMRCVDHLCEFRLIGGEPLVNKDAYKIIEKLISYKNADKIIIYTNATIVPKGGDLESLKHEKVSLDISNYGPDSRKHDLLVETLKENEITFQTKNVDIWTDSGGIRYREETENELVHKFNNCCVNDVMSLMHGNLYRCPFSANGSVLNAIPYNSNDVVDVADENISFDELKCNILDLYNNRSYISACSYCNGRDYTVDEIKAAIQVKKPMPYEIIGHGGSILQVEKIK